MIDSVEKTIAGVTQLVEYLPSKQTVARSSRVTRSIFSFEGMQGNECGYR